MPGKFYLATRKDRLNEAALLLDALEANGWKQTFTWSDQELADPGGSAAIAMAELAGLRECVKLTS